MTRWLRQDIWHTSGQDLIEYAILASFISLAVVSAVLLLGTNTGGLSNGVFQRAVAALGAAL